MERILTPQQELFLAAYTNPKSDTFGNALQSGLKAGYSQEYSESITYQLPEWLMENLGDMKMLRKAERVLEKTLEEDYDEQEILVDGLPTGKVKREPALSKIKQDSAKFVAERLGKKKYSTRTELTGENGGAIEIKGVEINVRK